MDAQSARNLLSDQWWRLNNLYHILDKDGKRVRFQLNGAQTQLYREMDFNNVILKARQLGFTTFIDLYILDTCIFNGDVKAGIIAHHKDDAEVILRDKIKYPYMSLPEGVRQTVRANTDRATELLLSNGSSIRVSTSMRSGTVQILHVSEMGKIAAKYPDKSREIRTGAFEAVGKGNIIFVESTAEGREGDFYNLVQRARQHAEAKKKLGQMDWKFFFFPWWKNPEYVDDFAVIDKEMREYFELLERDHGVTLTKRQKYWYTNKRRTLQEDMKREHPSTPDEAFEASIEGAYYGRNMAKMRRENRITKVPYDPHLPVNTFWDLGMSDTQTIWFHQRYGTQNRLIDYEEGSGEGMAYYARILQEKPYIYGAHYMPHDINVRDLGTGITRKATAESLGITPIIDTPRPRNQQELLDQIEAVRVFLATCFIDEENCATGILSLENYRKEWDDKAATFKKTPLHNWACHAADGLRTGAVGFRAVIQRRQDALVPEWTEDY